MVAGPEQARMLDNFEKYLHEKNENNSQQHEQGHSTESRFKTEVINLCDAISNVGNLFLDDCSELLALDTRNCAHEAVVNTVRTIKDIGKEQYDKYVKEVIKHRGTSIHQRIRRNNLALFSNFKQKFPPKKKQQIDCLKSDCRPVKQ